MSQPRSFAPSYANNCNGITSSIGKNNLSTLGINNINGLYDDAFWREKGLNVAYEHTAYTSMAKIKSVANKKK